MMTVTDGVLPAIDKAVALGYADPARLGIMGYSYGAYTAAAILTQTHRFQAAVVGDGFYDLFSNYGEFPAKGKKYYSGFTPGECLSEGGQTNMRLPPWEDPTTYLRNSPLFSAQKIDTPLLIYHGDSDSSVAVVQAEELFTALQRQGKTVTFLRYWGEDHYAWGPGDSLDVWSHIFKWFDAHLMPGGKVAQESRN
jgi:dipeptidyl aminopeptidase/acylaminoacyl peptidase